MRGREVARGLEVVQRDDAAHRRRQRRRNARVADVRIVRVAVDVEHVDFRGERLAHGARRCRKTRSSCRFRRRGRRRSPAPAARQRPCRCPVAPPDTGRRSRWRSATGGIAARLDPAGRRSALRARAPDPPGAAVATAGRAERSRLTRPRSLPGLSASGRVMPASSALCAGSIACVISTPGRRRCGQWRGRQFQREQRQCAKHECRGFSETVRLPVRSALNSK